MCPSPACIPCIPSRSPHHARITLPYMALHLPLHLSPSPMFVANNNNCLFGQHPIKSAALYHHHHPLAHHLFYPVAYVVQLSTASHIRIRSSISFDICPSALQSAHRSLDAKCPDFVSLTFHIFESKRGKWQAVSPPPFQFSYYTSY